MRVRGKKKNQQRTEEKLQYDVKDLSSDQQCQAPKFTESLIIYRDKERVAQRRTWPTVKISQD